MFPRTQGPRRPLLPPSSSRTLHHPSLLPLYLAADFGFRRRRDLNNQTVHPIAPADIFYTDPTMSCGSRIPNLVTDLRVFDCFQLNTPPPVMSACPAPSSCPDPFRSGPHPTRDLGSPTWRMHKHHHQVQPSHIILQLTQEEDQAITNLLKLHHQSPLLSSEAFSSAQMDFPHVVEPQQDLSSSLFYRRAADYIEEAYKPLCSDVQQGGAWSNTELEAANTLLNCFILMEEDRNWTQDHHKSRGTLPETRPYRHHGDSSVSTEALLALITPCSTQNDFRSVREDGECGCEDVRSTEEFVSGEVRKLTLSDSERDAVHGLLTLGTMGTLDMVQ